MSDNAAASGIVIGGRPVRPMDIDLRWVGGIMYVNGEIEETGVAAGVLGHPAMGVAWLANRLGTLGTAMEPGHIVLAGSFTRVVFPKKGDTLHARLRAAGRDFGAVRLAPRQSLVSCPAIAGHPANTDHAITIQTESNWIVRFRGR